MRTHMLERTGLCLAAALALGLSACGGKAGSAAGPRTAGDEAAGWANEDESGAKARRQETEVQTDRDRKRQVEDERKAAAASRAEFDRGVSAFNSGDLNGAKAYFEKAIAAEPTKNAGAYANLGTVLYLQARASGDKSLYNEAVGKLRRALAIESDTMAAYSTLALIYYDTADAGDRSKLKLAELVCNEAKKINDKYAPIYNTQGLILLKLKNVTGALKEFEKAVQLDPKFVEAHLNIGAIGLSSRSYDKAEKSFRAVLDLQGNNVDAIIGMGVAARGQRRVDEAERYYKQAASLDKNNCAVPYNLGLLYQDYKSTPEDMKLAQNYYRDYLRCGRTDKTKVADSERRIKDIDDTFAAIEQQKKMEEETRKMQEEAERQMKQMQEQQKAQEQQGGAAPPAQ